MSAIHVLTGSIGGIYKAVLHVTTPVGNNAAGVPWVTAIVNAGLNKTIMTIGVGPGQITQAERDAVVAGTTIEIVSQWQDDPAFTGPQRLSDFTLRTSQLSNDALAALQKQLNYFGFTQ